MKRVLVSYASKHGSTEEVARSIGATLRRAGFDIDVRAADLIRDVGEYDGVVLGGSIYMGRWHVEARRFLERHRDALGSIPLAVFALGPDSMENAAASRKQLERALERVRVEPDLAEIFGGVIDPEKLRFPFNHMRETDQRDWAAIDAWAETVGSLIANVPAPVAV